MRPERPSQLDLANIYGTKLVAWFDASRPRAGNFTAGFSNGVADGSALEEWQSLAAFVPSAGARNVGQATGARQPTWQARGYFGKPAVRFDGGDQLTDLSTGTNLFSGSAQATVVTVWSASVAKADGYLWAVPKSAGGNGFDLRTTTAASNTQCSVFLKTPSANADVAIGASFEGAAYTDSRPQYHEIIVDCNKSADDMVMYGTFGGANAVTVAGSTIDIGQPLTVGGFSSSYPTLGFQGDLHELIFFDVKLSTSELKRIRRYLKAKWGARLPTYPDPYSV